MYLQKSMNTSEKKNNENNVRMKTSKKWMNTIQKLKKNIEKSIDNLPNTPFLFSYWGRKENVRKMMKNHGKVMENEENVKEVKENEWNTKEK